MKLLLPSVFIVLGISLSGCQYLGVAAQALPPATIPPRYEGLLGQRVAVMAWAEHGVLLDWANMPLDITGMTQGKLHVAEKQCPKQLKDTTYPLSPLSIARYQEEHPEWEAESILDVAPRLGVSRLIYVEVQSFQTRSNASVDLYRGDIIASVKVIEIRAGKASIAYEEDGIHSTYPEKSPEEGIPNANDGVMYNGTLDAFTTELVKRFIPHPAEDDRPL